MKKWIILAVVLAGGAWGFEKWRNSLPGTGASATDSHPTTAVVETRDIHFAVSAAGELGPADQVSVGQAVSGSGGCNCSTDVLAIASLNGRVNNANSDQADVTRVKIGQQVEVQAEAVGGLKATGNVESIAEHAAIENNIKGYAERI